MSTLLKTIAVATGLLMVSCTSLIQQKEEPKVDLPPASLMDLQALYAPNSYEQFVATKTYPSTMRVYRNEALLAKAKGNCTIYVCLDQQRGRMYVGGKVAADWPVSTGVPGRATATGSFTILEKKENYASNLYGSMYNAEGRRINGDAKSSDAVPEGGKFVAAPMPYWQRISWDGIGMHIGRVKAGRRLSHGCIRTPRAVARELFGLTTLKKTRVYVVQHPEKAYYVKDILAKKVGLPEMTAEQAAAVAKAKAEAKAAKAKAKTTKQG